MCPPPPAGDQRLHFPTIQAAADHAAARRAACAVDARFSADADGLKYNIEVAAGTYAECPASVASMAAESIPDNSLTPAPPRAINGSEVPKCHCSECSKIKALSAVPLDKADPENNQSLVLQARTFEECHSFTRSYEKAVFMAADLIYRCFSGAIKEAKFTCQDLGQWYNLITR